MTQIRFATGNFLQFTATRTFALGPLGMKIAKGDSLEFDGSTVIYAGAQHPLPQLRATLTSGWLVLSEDYDEANPEYGIRTSARIQVRPAVAETTSMDGSSSKNARTVSTVAQHDERVVLNYKQHAETTQAQNGFKRVAVTTSGGQEGVAVRTLSTPSKQRTELTASSAGAALRAATDGVPTIVPGQGITQEEMLERMDPEAAEAYLAQKASRKAQFVTEPAPTNQIVGRVKNRAPKQAEGMKITQSVGGGLDIGEDGPVVATIKSSDTKTSRVEDGIVFTNTNVPDKGQKTRPRAAAVVPSLEVSPEIRLRIAKAVCPDFPASYDFSASPKKKLARLQADFEDRLDILQAVFAAESDAMKQQLVEEFPEAFSA